MKKINRKEQKFTLHGVLIILFLVYSLITIFLSQTSSSKRTQIKSRAAEPSYILTTSITSPPWGTMYKWKDRAVIEAAVEHTYPLEKVVFKLAAGNSRKDVCIFTDEPFICNYTVPYTGNGAHIPKGADTKAGYAFEVYTYDTMGHINVVSHQLWSYK